MPDPSLGAYGLRISGLPGAVPWMQPQEAGAPTFEIVARVGEPDLSPSSVDEERADMRLVQGGRMRARRGERRAEFTVREVPSDAELLHPYLAPAAALFWQWEGHEALHAGAVLVDDRAVLVLGEKGAGKSTTLWWLVQERNATVVADDLAVIHEGAVLAGPRSVDLRSVSDAQGDLRGDRQRIKVGAAPLRSVPAGVVVLAWASDVAIEPISPNSRLGVLADQRTYPPLTGDPRQLLTLAALPMYRLERPRDPSSLRASGEALLRAFA